MSFWDRDIQRVAGALLALGMHPREIERFAARLANDPAVASRLADALMGAVYGVHRKRGSLWDLPTPSHRPQRGDVDSQSGILDQLYNRIRTRRISKQRLLMRIATYRTHRHSMNKAASIKQHLVEFWTMATESQRRDFAAWLDCSYDEGDPFLDAM